MTSAPPPSASSDALPPPWVADMLSLLQQQNQQMVTLMEKLLDNKVAATGPTAMPLSAPDPYGDLVRDLPTFCYEADDESTFKDWFGRYGPVIQDRGSTLSDERKRNLLLDKLDRQAYKTYSDYVLPLEPRQIDLTNTVEKLTKLFGPKRTLIRRRFEFLQSTCEPLTMAYIPYRDFSNKIKKKFEDAAMKDVDSDSLKCLVFLSGLTDTSHSDIRLRLLNRLNCVKEDDPSPSLDDFVNDCETFVALRSDNRTMESKDVNIAHHIKSSGSQRRRPSRGVTFRHRSTSHEQQDRKTERSTPNGARRRFTPKKSRSRQRNYRCNNTEVAAVDARTYLKVEINGFPTRLQLDTGSDITMISRRTWKQIGSPSLSCTTMSIKTADGSPMHIMGFFEANFTILDRHRRATIGQGNCYVTESTNLLGLEWCVEMTQYRQLKEQFHCRLATAALQDTRYETVAFIKRNFAEVFLPGLGHCKKAKAKLFLKPNAQPIYRQKRPVPFASQPNVDMEIDRLLAENVLSPVDHSSWAAPIVVVKKSNGSIRLCADFSTGLNDSLMLHQHPLPTTEEIFAKLNGGELFSQIDLADAYLQIEVDEESKELLTINTHRGLFRYNRLPFGVKSAPGIFQQIIDSMISGLPGVAAYLDDIIVTGRTTEEHRTNLKFLFKRIHDYGFHIRLQKCHFMMPEIRYLGVIIDKNGRRPDPDKIRSITEMPRPQDLPQLRSFLGMINYYGTFVKEMHNLRAPLDALLKKDAEFKWTSEQEEAFKQAKEVIASPLLLTHYDPKLEIVVAADASDYGIGAVITHRFKDGTEKAICHASRRLNESEKKYGQIEKEGLALVFAVRKFHRYLMGRPFTLLTDHKPLLAIFGSKKGVPTYTANRLLRWSLILMAYDFHIEYRRTTDFGQADALSRLIAEQSQSIEDLVIAKASEEAEAACRSTCKVVPIDMNKVAEESIKDEVLSEVMNFVRKDSWPQKPPREIARYASLRQALSLDHDCLFFGPRIVIPMNLHRRVLDLLHDGHPGTTRMKTLARSCVYWTNITKDIEDYVRRCQGCQEEAKEPIKATLFSWPQETEPWARIHIDFTGPVNGKMFLVIVDAFSKWPEIIEMSSTTTKATIRQLSRLFAQFGNPRTLVSDNGSQFTSGEFANFCRTNGIEHVRSPPFHPQSNGQAERFVDTFKRAMRKLEGQENDSDALQKFLAVYRRTPCSSSPNGLSPAENFLQRKIRSPLSLLTTPRTRTKMRNHSMEEQFNHHHGARAKTFDVDDVVWVRGYGRNQKRWVPGKVINRHGNAVFDVITNGTIQRRHANQLRHRIQESSRQPPTDISDIIMDTHTYPSQSPSSRTPAEQPTVQKGSGPEPEATSRAEQRPQRIRRPPIRLQIDPMLRSYT